MGPDRLWRFVEAESAVRRVSGPVCEQPQNPWPSGQRACQAGDIANDSTTAGVRTINCAGMVSRPDAVDLRGCGRAGADRSGGRTFGGYIEAGRKRKTVEPLRAQLSFDASVNGP